MLTNLSRLWTRFRAMPGIVQAALGLVLIVVVALLIPRPSAAQDSLMVPAQFVCAGGRLLAVRVSVPAVSEPSVLTIPPDVCQRQP